MDDINKRLRKNENIDPETALAQEKRVPLSETPYYRMIGYMMQLPRRFSWFQQDYYGGRQPDCELEDITTQPFGQSMQICKQRLKKQGLTMETQLSYPNNSFYHDNMESLEDTQNWYGIRSADVRVQRRFYKNGKCIYKKKSREKSVISILQSKVDGNIAFCPNCGYQDSISSFTDGCAACGSQFTIHDFEPKVSGFSSQESIQTKSQDTIAAILFAVIVFGCFGGGIFLILGFILELINIFLGLPSWLEYINNIVSSILYAGLSSLVILLFAVSLLEFILEKTNKQKDCNPVTGQEYGKNLFPNFSIPDFYQNVEYKLRNIHLIDHAKNVSSFVKCDLSHIVPSYKNVVDCDLTRLHFTGGKETEHGYSIQCEATMRLFCYSRKHIRKEYDRIKLFLYGKKNVVDQPVTAMRMYPCPTCSSTLNLFEGSKCKYCGNTYDFTNFDWVIESYEEVDRKKDHTSEIIWWYILIVFTIPFLFFLQTLL